MNFNFQNECKRSLLAFTLFLQCLQLAYPLKAEENLLFGATLLIHGALLTFQSCPMLRYPQSKHWCSHCPDGQTETLESDTTFLRLLAQLADETRLQALINPLLPGHHFPCGIT
jgi:hypothetical protein